MQVNDQLYAPKTLPPGKVPWQSWDSMLGGPQCPSGYCRTEKNLLLSHKWDPDSLITSHQPSHYIDSAIPAKTKNLLISTVFPDHKNNYDIYFRLLSVFYIISPTLYVTAEMYTNCELGKHKRATKKNKSNQITYL